MRRSAPPRDESQGELLCDIVDGRLMENGRDPLQPRRGSIVTTTSALFEEPEKPQTMLPAPGRAGLNDSGTLISVKAMSTQAAQILRLVVGLLGLEVHEAPSQWSEAWLTFEDATRAQLGLGSEVGAPPDMDARQYHAQQTDWKTQVLSHLRGLLEHGNIRGTGALGAGDAAAGGGAQPGGMLPKGAGAAADGVKPLGPDFQEHLQLAEYMLGRITHTVGVLEDPEGLSRPMVLREYTNEMVSNVCTDLRQWLEQLSMLLSLYHVHILDLENERGRLSKSVVEYKTKVEVAAREGKEAVTRRKAVEEAWKEEKMKQRAEAMLGVSLGGGDAKIYSQMDVDEMMKEWKIEHVNPLLQEIKDLKAERDALLGKTGGKRPARPGSGSHDGLSPEAQKLTVQALSALGDVIHDEQVSLMAQKMANSVETGAADMANLLSQISGLRRPGVGSFSPMMSESDGVPACLAAVAGEIERLEVQLKQSPGMKGLTPLFTWSKDSLRGVTQALYDGTSNFLWEKPPSWDVSALAKLNRPAAVTKTQGTNTTGVSSFGAGGRDGADGEGGEKGMTEAQWQAKLRALRAELEAQLRAAWAALEAEKERTREALERLAAETKRANDAISELRRKMLEMEAHMKKAGLGKQAADAIMESGLADFLQGRDVFERLYRDALHRMKRLAQAQMCIMETGRDPLRQAFENIMAVPAKHMEGSEGEGYVPFSPGQLHRGRPRTKVPGDNEGGIDRSHSPLQVSRLGPERDSPSPGQRVRVPVVHVTRSTSPEKIMALHRPPGQVHLEPLTVQSLARSPASQQSGTDSGSSPAAHPSQGPPSRGVGASPERHSRERLVTGPPAKHSRMSAQELLDNSLETHTWSTHQLGTADHRSERPQLSVGGVGIGGGARVGGSLLLPQGMRARRGAEPPHPKVPRPTSSMSMLRSASPPSRMLRSAGSMSMQQLPGPPRLLMQSVGSVY